MESRRPGPIGRLKQPEYTGENRCVPCTVVNVAIATVLGLAAALVHPFVGIGVIGFSLVAIYLRGYLVPGTPALTKRYFPDWLLAVFDKAPEPGTGGAVQGTSETQAAGDDAIGGSEAADGEDGDGERPEPVDPEQVLVDGGLVVPCEDVDDLCLTDDTRDRFRTRATQLRDGDRRSQLAAFLETEPDAVEIHRAEGTEHVRVNTTDGTIARWESDAALVADLAGSDVLAETVPGWDDLPLKTRSQVASGLRAFVDRCPACGGPISIDGETVESCCRSYQVYAITCDDCEARILEVRQ